jgi:hypothetical protein
MALGQVCRQALCGARQARQAFADGPFVNGRRGLRLYEHLDAHFGSLNTTTPPLTRPE